MAAIPPIFANDPNGQNPGLPSEKELMRRQALAHQLLKGSQSTEPLTHPLQVIGKWAQAGAGAFAQNRIDQQMKQGQQMRQNAMLNSIPGNGKGGLW